MNAYEIGYNHGTSGAGTNGYKPGNRKCGGESKNNYDNGFRDGMADYHDATRLDRKQDAWLNLPKATRGERPTN